MTSELSVKGWITVTLVKLLEEKSRHFRQMTRERKLELHTHLEAILCPWSRRHSLTTEEVREANRGSNTEILYNMLIRRVANTNRLLPPSSTLCRVLCVHYLVIIFTMTLIGLYTCAYDKSKALKNCYLCTRYPASYWRSLESVYLVKWDPRMCYKQGSIGLAKILFRISIS